MSVCVSIPNNCLIINYSESFNITNTMCVLLEVHRTVGVNFESSANVDGVQSLSVKSTQRSQQILAVWSSHASGFSIHEMTRKKE